MDRATVVVEWQRVEGKGERKKMVEKGGRRVVIKYDKKRQDGGRKKMSDGFDVGEWGG